MKVKPPAVKDTADPNANFTFTYWEEGTVTDYHPLNNGLPPPPDRYRPGLCSWGKNVERSQAIQRGRMRRRYEANKAFFKERVLPLVVAKLNPEARRNLLSNFPELQKEIMLDYGMVRFALGERASWVHPTKEAARTAQCIAMNAVVTHGVLPKRSKAKG